MRALKFQSILRVGESAPFGRGLFGLLLFFAVVTLLGILAPGEKAKDGPRIISKLGQSNLGQIKEVHAGTEAIESLLYPRDRTAGILFNLAPYDPTNGTTSVPTHTNCRQ